MVVVVSHPGPADPGTIQIPYCNGWPIFPVAPISRNTHPRGSVALTLVPRINLPSTRSTRPHFLHAALRLCIIKTLPVDVDLHFKTCGGESFKILHITFYTAVHCLFFFWWTHFCTSVFISEIVDWWGEEGGVIERKVKVYTWSSPRHGFVCVCKSLTLQSKKVI